MAMHYEEETFTEEQNKVTSIWILNWLQIFSIILLDRELENHKDVHSLEVQ